MTMQVGSAPASASALSAYADNIADEADREEAKLLKSRKAARQSNMVDAARTKIEERRRAADEDLKAAQDKANGSFWGNIIGLVLGVILIVVGAIFFPPLVAVGAAIIAAGGALGGAIGAKNAKDNEEASAEATEKADSAELMEKLYEKQVEDDLETIRQINQLIQQRWQDARQREAAENRWTLQG